MTRGQKLDRAFELAIQQLEHAKNPRTVPESKMLLRRAAKNVAKLIALVDAMFPDDPVQKSR